MWVVSGGGDVWRARSRGVADQTSCVPVNPRITFSFRQADRWARQMHREPAACAPDPSLGCITERDQDRRIGQATGSSSRQRYPSIAGKFDVEDGDSAEMSPRARERGDGIGRSAHARPGDREQFESPLITVIDQNASRAGAGGSRQRRAVE
jgi:hypothetical protein